MLKNDSFSVSDYIIDSDQIFIVTHITSDRLYYQPAKKEDCNQSVTGSIPIKNIASSGLRHPISSDIIKTFFKNLAINIPNPLPFDAKSYKDILYLNDPLKNISLLQQLWKSKNKIDKNLSFNNRLTFEGIINHLSADYFRKKIISTLSAN